MQTISIVIPNYNGEALLRENLPEVIKAAEISGYKIEIVIPDDASADGSIAFLEKYRNSLTKGNMSLIIVKNPQNKGFSGNVNSGVKKSSGELLVLLNTDVVPHKGFLKELVPHFENKNVFAVGCMDESIENGGTVLRGRGKAKWKRGFFIHGPAKIEAGKSLWASGGSSVFRKSLWESVGGLNEIYDPFYWEDIDLSYRAQKMGYDVLFEPKSVVIHTHSKGAIKSQNTPVRIERIAYRNQFLFVWLNITDTNFILSHLIWLPTHLLHALIRGNTTLLAGFFLALQKLPLVLLQRQKNIKRFVRTDSAVLDEVKNL